MTTFDTKIKIILRNGLEPWQELNVTAFLVSGIAGTQAIIGEPYIDADGVQYLPMSQQPIMIHTANVDQLRDIMKKAIEKEMAVTIYTNELFTTYNDEDNRTEIAKYTTDKLDLVGIGIRGKKNPLDRITKGIDMHR
ncbi:MAG: DUF2000 domain-containing protein [Hespellia sp.]|nr:DUF2000 domain-containing protein [Hespellia sp.]